ncbi:uncharacterized protein [Zea mays]|uniref:uncharacterized protein n=1 Tax=Zea mays TaxID=4577 RepID=UPI0004DE9AE4|nr:uncharacterized protein LOC103636932 [Zea mays]|eukprot:XP_008657456.1 uncharacterized protein LOC103636932 [Zea mays]
MSCGGSAGGGQSSLGYLFGSGEPPKPVVAPAASAPPVEKPSTAKTDATMQPLKELPEKKCKRCGLYEEGTFKPNVVFDEWEMCLSDFKGGKYTRFKEGQFNATFLCPNCTASTRHGNPGPSEDLETKKTSIAVIIVVSVLASVLVVTALFGGFRYWQKKKRERDQAWFLKLFEERDDLEDELGLSNEF